MATYWNFREILDFHPLSEHRCVAINVKSGERCGIIRFMNRGGLAEAETLLDAMDRTESLSECRGHLNKLAYLTVCKSPHRRMPEVLADCRRRWNSKISAYVTAEEMKKAKEQKSKKAIKTRNTEQRITADLKGQDIVKITPLTTAETPQPQEDVRSHFFLPTNKTAEPINNTEDPFINDNETASRLQPRSEALIHESPDTSTIHHSSDDLTSDTFDSKPSEVLKDNTKIPSTLQSYGLQTPPSSTLDSRVSKRQESTNTQSPPKTPTKLPASANHTQPGFFGLPLTPPTTETKPSAKIGTSESASPSPMFNFGSTSRTFGSQLSPNINLKKNPEEKTKFAVDFGRNENTINNFRFQLPSSPSRRTERQENSTTHSKDNLEKKTNFEVAFGSSRNTTNFKFEFPSPPSSKLESKEISNAHSKNTPEKKTNFGAEFGSGNSTMSFNFEMPPTPSSKSESQERANTKNETEATETTSSATMDSSSLGYLVLDKIADKDQLKVAEPSTVLPSLLSSSKPVDKDAAPAQSLGVLNSSKQLDTQNNSEKESNILAPVEPEPSLEITNQQELPAFDSATLEDQYFLPPISKTATQESNIKNQPAKSHKLEEATTDNLPVFEFGTDNEVAPPTFDFGTSSKESLLLSVPPTSSKTWDCFISDQEKEPLVAESSNIALKTDVRQSESLSTLEDTPELSQEERSIPALAKSSSPVSSVAEASEDTSESLELEDEDESEDEDAPEEPEVEDEDENEDGPDELDVEDEDKDEISSEKLAKNSPESSETPIMLYDRFTDLTKTEDMLELSHVPEGSIPSTPEQLPSPVESTPSSHMQNGNKEIEGDLAFNGTPKPPQVCDKSDHDDLDEIAAAKPSSDSDRTSEDVVFPVEEHSFAPEAILEPSKSNQDSAVVIEEDTTSCEVESELPKPDQKDLNVDEESNTDDKKEYEQSTPVEEAFSTIDDINLSRITSETINESAPTEAESFGHALIDPSERRYTMPFSGYQRKALPTTSEIQRISSNTLDEDTFSKIEPHIEPFTTPSRARWSQDDGESMAASEEGEDILLRENPEWENDRGLPRLGRRRRWRKEIVRKSKEGYEIVAGVVQGKARRISKLYSRASE